MLAIGYILHVVQYIAEPVLHPVVCTPHSPTPVLLTTPPLNHQFVLHTCEFAYFMSYFASELLGE